MWHKHAWDVTQVTRVEFTTDGYDFGKRQVKAKVLCLSCGKVREHTLARCSLSNEEIVKVIKARYGVELRV